MTSSERNRSIEAEETVLANRQRATFMVALVLFLIWVGFLALMARFSAERPRVQGAVGAPG